MHELTLLFAWFKAQCKELLDIRFNNDSTLQPKKFYEENSIPKNLSSSIGKFALQYQSDPDAIMLVLMALTPHIAPGFFNDIMSAYLPEGGDMPQFGGKRGQHSRSILPTGETALFLLAGDDLKERIRIQRYFTENHSLFRNHILGIETVPDNEPPMTGTLWLNPEIIHEFLFDEQASPKFSMEFPAEKIHTEMTWDDLVLHPSTESQIQHLQDWLDHHTALSTNNDLAKRIKSGFRVLFFGPPGTGKTLTAGLIAQQAKRDLYRIDLSRVVSKYIGETEKNLARLFDRAEHKDWILFFDEADALFGKRTDIRDAHDKYANQEVSYLLQRIENYNGLVILATNQRNNIDDAFRRRFQAIVPFPLPRAEERLKLWHKAFSVRDPNTSPIEWKGFAERYEMSGASITNVMHYCALYLQANTNKSLSNELIESAILREFIKEGKMV